MTVEADVDAWLRQQPGAALEAWTTINWDNKTGGLVKIQGGKFGVKGRTIEVFEGTSYVGKQAKWKMTDVEWRKFWDFVENQTTYFTPATYQNVKANAEWQSLYGLAARQVAYLDKKGQITFPIVNTTMACKRCGLVLPFDSITVDHQKPKTGGEREALFKMFKVMGLTTDAFKSSGRKGKFWGGRDGFTFMFGDEPSIGWYNWAGVLFYTLLIESGHADDFAKVCIHHAINLAPMCLHCNAQKNNWGFR